MKSEDVNAISEVLEGKQKNKIKTQASKEQFDAVTAKMETLLAKTSIHKNLRKICHDVSKKYPNRHHRLGVNNFFRNDILNYDSDLFNLRQKEDYTLLTSGLISDVLMMMDEDSYANRTSFCDMKNNNGFFMSSSSSSSSSSSRQLLFKESEPNEMRANQNRKVNSVLYLEPKIKFSTDEGLVKALNENKKDIKYLQTPYYAEDKPEFFLSAEFEFLNLANENMMTPIFVFYILYVFLTSSLSTQYLQILFTLHWQKRPVANVKYLFTEKDGPQKSILLTQGEGHDGFTHLVEMGKFVIRRMVMNPSNLEDVLSSVEMHYTFVGITELKFDGFICIYVKRTDEVQSGGGGGSSRKRRKRNKRKRKGRYQRTRRRRSV